MRDAAGWFFCFEYKLFSIARCWFPKNLISYASPKLGFFKQQILHCWISDVEGNSKLGFLILHQSWCQIRSYIQFRYFSDWFWESKNPIFEFLPETSLFTHCYYNVRCLVILWTMWTSRCLVCIQQNSTHMLYLANLIFGSNFKSHQNILQGRVYFLFPILSTIYVWRLEDIWNGLKKGADRHTCCEIFHLGYLFKGAHLIHAAKSGGVWDF